jgi:ABC-2 type transport system permease protein
LFGSLCNEKSIGGVSSIIISMHSVLSGMWFPTEGLDSGFIKVMDILPFKNATILVQNTLNGINNIFNDFLKPLIIILTYTILIFLLAIVVFKKKMKTK